MCKSSSHYLLITVLWHYCLWNHYTVILSSYHFLISSCSCHTGVTTSIHSTFIQSPSSSGKMASILWCKCLRKLLIRKNGMQCMMYVSVKLDCDYTVNRLKTVCENACEIITVYDISCTATQSFVNCHLTLKTCMQCSLVFIKLANDCMYASWNFCCLCSVTWSPCLLWHGRLVYCDIVALFIVTWSPCLLWHGYLVYCDMVALFIVTWSPCLLWHGRLVHPKWGETYHCTAPTIALFSYEHLFEILWHCVALFIPSTAWEPITVSDVALLHGYVIAILHIPCSHMNKISVCRQVSTNSIKCIWCWDSFICFIDMLHVEQD